MMNEWIQRSIEIAQSEGYLDKLHEIYPVTENLEREIPQSIQTELKELYEGEDDIRFLEKLLDLPKFPINDPYVAFLRRNKNALKDNPKTVGRIVKRVRELGFDGMVKAITSPKEFNRQMGSLFRRWLELLDYPVVGEAETGDHQIKLLGGGDSVLLEFARRELKLDLDKSPDFIIRVNDKYVVGEAKFLTDYGGHQYAQLQDALRLLDYGGKNVLIVAVLDGVVWIKNSTKMRKTVCKQTKPVFTALLLREYISSIV